RLQTLQYRSDQLESLLRSGEARGAGTYQPAHEPDHGPQVPHRGANPAGPGAARFPDFLPPRPLPLFLAAPVAAEASVPYRQPGGNRRGPAAGIPWPGCAGFADLDQRAVTGAQRSALRALPGALSQAHEAGVTKDTGFPHSRE